MSTLEIGDKAPAFSASDDSGAKLSLKDFKGEKFVLYFYPKDDTPGCTKEACTFTENLSAFNKLGVKVVGVSKDSVAKHVKFKEKYGLKFPLLSDEDGAICEAYGTWIEKSMYGRKYMGVERTTVLIGPDGRIVRIWSKVKVPGHADEVLAAVKAA